MLKPRACLATLAPSGERPTLKRYLRDAEPGLQVVAPLDFPAEGVVLLTTDGELAQAMSKPPRVPPMTYHVKLQGHGRRRRRRTPAQGLEAGRGGRSSRHRWTGWPPPTRTPGSRWSSPRPARARSRRPAISIRHSLLKISRIRLGGLSFEGLKMGGWRDLTKTEIADLRHARRPGRGDGSLRCAAAARSSRRTRSGPRTK